MQALSTRISRLSEVTHEHSGHLPIPDFNLCYSDLTEGCSLLASLVRFLSRRTQRPNLS
jgi:hypothetical protein